MRLYVLPVGTVEVNIPRFMPMDRDRGEFYTGPLTAFLIRTDEGHNVLVDTGPSAAGVAQRAVRRDPTDTLATVRPEDDIVARLGEIGVAPADVTHVVVSHFDYDHCGGNRHFPGAVFFVQADHHAFARRTPQRCPPGDWDLPGLHYELVDGDVEVLPGIQVLRTPGHAPGHQSVVVRGLAETGTVILTADAARTHREFEQELRGGVPEDDETIASIRRMKQVRDAEHATVLTSHDMDAHRGVYRLSPAYYA